MWAALLLALTLQAGPQEVLTEVRIQGNVATSDADVLRMAGVQVGTPFEAGTPDEVAQRLRATKQFERVEVLKRFASIADPTRIILVIIVDEGPVRIQMTGDPDHPTRVVRSRRPNILFLPELNTTDGYGLTYGVRLAVPDVAGPHSRLSFPLTWGGVKRAGADLEKRFSEGPISRVVAGATATDGASPFFNDSVVFQRVSLRGEHDINPTLRLGALTGWQHVSFQGTNDRFTYEGVDLTFDNRLDPFLARNAAYARVAWTHYNFDDGGTSQLDLGARVFVGLIRQTTLVLSAGRSDSDRPLPDYLRPQLGGVTNLRGFDAGIAIGDTFIAGSAELLVPVTSPLHIARFGVSAFTDAGTVYDKGQHLSDQAIKHSVGGGVWFAAAFVRAEIFVAHGIGAGTRVGLGGAVSF